jgi:hypothetical protein
MEFDKKYLRHNPNINPPETLYFLIGDKKYQIQARYREDGDLVHLDEGEYDAMNIENPEQHIHVILRGLGDNYMIFRNYNNDDDGDKLYLPDQYFDLKKKLDDSILSTIKINQSKKQIPYKSTRTSRKIQRGTNILTDGDNINIRFAYVKRGVGEDKIYRVELKEEEKDKKGKKRYFWRIISKKDNPTQPINTKYRNLMKSVNKHANDLKYADIYAPGGEYAKSMSLKYSDSDPFINVNPEILQSQSAKGGRSKMKKYKRKISHNKSHKKYKKSRLFERKQI